MDILRNKYQAFMQSIFISNFTSYKDAFILRSNWLKNWAIVISYMYVNFAVSSLTFKTENIIFI